MGTLITFLKQAGFKWRIDVRTDDAISGPDHYIASLFPAVALYEPLELSQHIRKLLASDARKRLASWLTDGIGYAPLRSIKQLDSFTDIVQASVEEFMVHGQDAEFYTFDGLINCDNHTTEDLLLMMFSAPFMMSLYLFTDA